MKSVICFDGVNTEEEDIMNRKTIALCLLPLHCYEPQPLGHALSCSCLHEKGTSTSSITLLEAITHSPICFRS